MQSDEEQIRQLVAIWMAATKSGDGQTVLSLIADDAVFLVAGQPVLRKSDFAAALDVEPGSARPQFDGSSDIQEIKVLGDWAFMWARLTVVITPPGGARPVRRTGHTLSILKKEGGKWMLARDANMLTVAPDDGQVSKSVPSRRDPLPSAA